MFELAHAWVLLLLPLPWLVWFFYPRAKTPLTYAVKVPFFASIAKCIEKMPATSAYKDVAIFFLIWMLLLLALSGPLYVGNPQPIAREGYNILLALDLSSSMQITDMSQNGHLVSRLAVVRRAAEQFVNDRTGDKIGLILFGTQAYLQTPLTYDRQNVLQRIQDATVGLAGNTTSIGDALGLAVKRMQNVPKKGRIIILLTDGANNSGVLAPLKAAELAKTDGIKIYTIGLSSDIDPQSFGGMFLQVNAGADLDEDTLKDIASMTNGRYFRATDLQSLKEIYQTINQMEKVEDKATAVRPQYEYYMWPLALALVLFMGWLMLQTDVVPLLKRRMS